MVSTGIVVVVVGRVGPIRGGAVVPVRSIGERGARGRVGGDRLGGGNRGARLGVRLTGGRRHRQWECRDAWEPVAAAGAERRLLARPARLARFPAGGDRRRAGHGRTRHGRHARAGHGRSRDRRRGVRELLALQRRPQLDDAGDLERLERLRLVLDAGKVDDDVVALDSTSGSAMPRPRAGRASCRATTIRSSSVAGSTVA